MRTNRATYLALTLAVVLLTAPACRQNSGKSAGASSAAAEPLRADPPPVELPSTLKRVVEDGVEQTKYTLHYDPTYARIGYPGGDVPLERGVCTDVIIRAFRKAGVDLQREVHEDMARNFAAYPKKWGMKAPDSNIDHRRVQNLMYYFERKGRALAVTDNPADYLPGDVVAWDLGGGYDHIGLVTNLRTDDARGFMVVHHMGNNGPKVENVLFAWRITGHYRYF